MERKRGGSVSDKQRIVEAFLDRASTQHPLKRNAKHLLRKTYAECGCQRHFQLLRMEIKPHVLHLGSE